MFFQEMLQALSPMRSALDCFSLKCLRRCIHFKTSVIAAVAQLAIHAHRYMPGLAGKAIGPVHNAAFVDDAVPHTGSERQHVEAIDSELLSAAQVTLCQRCYVGVVIEKDRNIEIFVQCLVKVEPIPP